MEIMKESILEESKNEVMENSSSTELMENEDDTSNKFEDLKESIHDVVAPTEFSSTVNEAKVKIVKDAQESDEKFVHDLKSKLKDAALESAEVEKSKAQLEKQHIKYHSEVLETQQLKNEYTQSENKWTNKENKRLFHYNGVKPIMEFVGIKSPMNLFVLYLFTIILSPFYLINKLLKATIGALIAGAQDEDRSKTAKGILWTMACLLLLMLIAFLLVLLLRWLGIDILESIRN